MIQYESACNIHYKVYNNPHDEYFFHMNISSYPSYGESSLISSLRKYSTALTKFHNIIIALY